MVPRSSVSFSPGRSPVYTISISRPGSSPDSRTRSRAISAMRTGSPISSTKISPPTARVEARSTSCTASGIVMK